MGTSELLFGVIGGGGSDDMVLISLLIWLLCCVFRFFIWHGKEMCEGFLETAVIKIGRMTILTAVLVQIKSNKREGKKHLAQG